MKRPLPRGKESVFSKKKSSRKNKKIFFLEQLQHNIEEDAEVELEELGMKTDVSGDCDYASLSQQIRLFSVTIKIIMMHISLG